MDGLEKKNIVNYGFLVFLILVGIISIFVDEQSIITRMSSLSIPLFLFSFNIILTKTVSIIREKINTEIAEEDSRNSSLINSEKRHSFAALHSSERYILLAKKFLLIDKITKILNLLAVICFVLCLLSISGILPIGINSIWVNTFSLAIVFFDFFVLDDIIARIMKRMLTRIEKDTETNMRLDYDNIDELE